MKKVDKNKPDGTQKQSVRFITITESQAGQRIDNFLMREMKQVPRSYIYRILRKGEVRVNKKRTKPAFKLSSGDTVRIPPAFLPEKNPLERVPASFLFKIEAAIVLEDNDLILINKPSGLAVHGGTGVAYGLIEAFRQLRPNIPFVELVHRLDRETSGLVMLAKNRPTLLALHDMMKHGMISKHYQTLVKGVWSGGRRHIKNRLQKVRATHDQNVRKKMWVVNTQDERSGKQAESIFSPIERYPGFSLLDVELLTGRMHQIRTQLAELGHPVLGDSQYGDFATNREVKKTLGLKRLFLQAYCLKFKMPHSGKQYQCNIPLAEDLQQVILALEKTGHSSPFVEK